MVLFDIGKSITCTAIGDTFQYVVTNTSVHDGEYDMHEGFPCDGWGVSADYSVSFDWKVDKIPLIDKSWFSILQIGEQKMLFFFLCNVHTILI